MGRRRMWGAIAAVMVVFALLPIDGSTAATDTGSVTVEKSGWWSQTNQEVTTTNGAIAPPIPKSPAVPEDSLPVTAFLGQPENVSAIAFTVPADMQVSSLVVTMPLADSGSADSGGSSAKIAACVVIAYWEGTDNGKWDAKPDGDCNKAKADGKRNDDGSWTFDLSPIAALWSDPFEDVVQPDGGVLLVPDDPSATFQVAFAKEGMKVEAVLAEASTPGDEAFTADVSQETIPAGTPTYSGGSVDAGALPPPTATGKPPASPGKGGGGGSQPAASRQHDVGNLTGNLPLGLLLLIPFALLLAVLAGQSTRRARSELVRRQGGVGRALAARAVRPIRRSHPEMP